MNGEHGPSRSGDRSEDANADAAGAFDPRMRVIASLCRRSLDGVRPSGLSGASVSRAVNGEISSLVYSADETAAALADLHRTLGEGPAVTAVAEHRPVVVPDINADQLCGSWLAFSDGALRMGVSSVVAIPLQIGVVGLGVLSLHGRRPAVLEDRDLRALLVVSDALAQVLLPSLAAVESPAHADWDSGLLGLNDALLHQATGMVSVQLRSSAEEALLSLRAHAFSSGLPLTEVARRIVERTLNLQEHSPDDPLGADHGSEKGDRDG